MKTRTFAWIALGLIVAAGLGFAGWVYQARRGFESRVQALRDAGEPVDLSELPRPAVPDEENAAPLLRSVVERLEKFDSDNDEYWYPYIVEEESLETNQRAIEARASLYAELDAALERPKFRLPDDATGDPLRMRIQHFFAASKAAGYIDARARVDLETPGGTPRAKKAVAQLMRLGSYIPSDGVLCCTVRIAVEGMAVGRLRKILVSTDDPETLRTEYDSLFAAADDERRIQIVFRNERAWMITSFEAILSGDSTAVYSVPWYEISKRYEEACDAIDQVGRAIECMHGSAPETVARLKRLHEGDERHVTAMALRVFVRDRFHLARLRAARIALALEVYHARHGGYPAALSELAPLFPDGVPLEPSTGAPFRYESTGATAVLRSGLEAAPISDMEDEWNALAWELAMR